MLPPTQAMHFVRDLFAFSTSPNRLRSSPQALTGSCISILGRV